MPFSKTAIVLLVLVAVLSLCSAEIESIVARRAAHSHAKRQATMVCEDLRATLQPLVDNGTLVYTDEGLSPGDTTYTLVVDTAVGNLALDPFLTEILNADSEDDGGNPLSIKSVTCDWSDPASNFMNVVLDLDTFLLVPNVLDLYNATVAAVVDLADSGASTLRNLVINGLQDLGEYTFRLVVTQGDDHWTIVSEEVPAEVTIDGLLVHFNYSAGMDMSYDDVLCYTSDLSIGQVTSVGGVYHMNSTRLMLRFSGSMEMVQLDGPTYPTSRSGVDFFIYTNYAVSDRPWAYLRVPFSVSSPGPTLHQLTEKASNMTAGDEFAANFTSLQTNLLGITRALFIAIQAAVPLDAAPSFTASGPNIDALINFDPAHYPTGVYSSFDATFESSVSWVSGLMTDKNVSFAIRGDPVLLRDGLSETLQDTSSLPTVLQAHDDFYQKSFSASDVLDSFCFDYLKNRMVFRHATEVSYSYFKSHSQVVTSDLSFFVNYITDTITSVAKANVTIGGQTFAGNITFSDGLFSVYGCYDNAGKDAADGFTVNIPSQGIEAYTNIDAMEMFSYTLQSDQISSTMDVLTDVNMYPFNISGLCWVWTVNGPTDSPSSMKAVADGNWPRSISEDDDIQGNAMTATAVFTLKDDSGATASFSTVLAFEVPDMYLPLFLEQLAGVNNTNSTNTLILQSRTAGFVVDVDNLGSLESICCDLSPFFADMWCPPTPTPTPWPTPCPCPICYNPTPNPNPNPASKLSLGFGFKWSEHCDLDRYCRVLRAIYGSSTQFFFTGDLQAATPTNDMGESFIRSFAPAEPITLDSSGDLRLESTVMLEFGNNMSQVTIDPQLYINSLGLCFNGSIRLTDQYEVALAVTTEQCWEKPFSFEWLKACECSIDATIDTASLPLDSVGMMSLRMDYGFAECSTVPLVGFFGLNFTDGSSSYLVGSLADMMDLPDFMATLCYTGTPVKVLRDATVMDLEVSYSAMEHSFVTADFDTQVVPAGLKMTGMVQILGQEGVATFSLDNGTDPTVLTIEVALDVLNLHDSSFTMRPTTGSGMTGPKFVAEVYLKSNKIPKMTLVGDLEVLGVTQSTSVRVTSNALQVYLRGNLFEEYDATVIIFGQYQGSLDTISFRCLGHFNTALLNRMTTSVVTNIVELARGAGLDLSNARDEARLANDTYYFALAGLATANSRLAEASANYTTEVNTLDQLKLDQVQICTNQTCQMECVACVTNRTCCAIVTNTCVQYCPEEDPCCFTVPNATCVRDNLLCAGNKTALEPGIDVQEGVVINARNQKTTKEDEVFAAEFQVNQTLISWQESQMKLQVLEDSSDVEIMAQRFIEDQGEANLFVLKGVSFNAPLPVARRGSFRASATASFLGEPFTRFVLDVDLVTYTNMVHRLSNLVYAGISDAGSDADGRKRRSTTAGHHGANNVQRLLDHYYLHGDPYFGTKN